MRRTVRAFWLAIISASELLAQNPAAPAVTLEFETALVKQVTLPADGRFAFGCRVDPAQLTCDYIHLKDLLAIAYPLTGGAKLNAPDWIDTISYRGLRRLQTA